MIYNLFAFAIWIIFAPFVLILTFKKKYRKSLPARFFLYKNPPFFNPQIHIHACSLGEVNSVAFLLEEFGKSVLSVASATGFEAGQKLRRDVRFLPFELFLPFWLKKSRVLIVFEAELWLNLFYYARKNGAFTILLNARISDKSYPKYLKFAFLYRKIFANIDLVMAQSEKDAVRLRELGAKNVEIWGNVKSANLGEIYKPSAQSSQIYNLNLDTNLRKFDKNSVSNLKILDRNLVVIASIHKNEIELILQNLTPQDGTIYIFAPRHPEAFEYAHAKFCAWASANGLNYERFTQNLGLKSRCILLDTLGELVKFYSVCDTAVLCGSFVDGIGGHNPIEIAQFGAKIISGEYIFNQKSLFECVENIEFASAQNLDEILLKPRKNSKILHKFDREKFINLIKEKL